MSALVVYESMFGNTKRVAEAIAAGVAEHLPVETVEVADAPTEIPANIELLIVGGPTHVHGMSTARSRAGAAARTTQRIVSRGIGIREWLAGARPRIKATPAVAFDTRINGRAIFTGSAAKGYAARLRSSGFRVVQPARSFLVGTAKGPLDEALLPGELEQARGWGSELAAKVEAKIRIR